MTNVKVACRIVNGITIGRYEPGEDDGTGSRPMRRIGAPVHLNGVSGVAAGASDSDGSCAEPGITEVDRDWMRAWMSENQGSDLVRLGCIEILDDDQGDAA